MQTAWVCLCVVCLQEWATCRRWWPSCAPRDRHSARCWTRSSSSTRRRWNSSNAPWSSETRSPPHSRRSTRSSRLPALTRPFYRNMYCHSHTHYSTRFIPAPTMLSIIYKLYWKIPLLGFQYYEIVCWVIPICSFAYFWNYEKERIFQGEQIFLQIFVRFFQNFSENSNFLKKKIFSAFGKLQH